MTDESYARNFCSFYEAVNSYKSTLDKQECSSFLTALLKYGIPALGIKVAKNKKITQEEREKILEKTKSIPFNKIGELPEKLEKYFDKNNINNDIRYPCRSRIKKFVNTYNAYIISEHDPEDLSIYRQNPPYAANKVRTTSREQVTKLKLETYPDSFNTELEEFAQFLRQNPDIDSERTVENHVSWAERYVGWLVRTNRIKFEDISLNKIVPFVKLYLCGVKREHMTGDLALKKMLAESECQDIGQNLVNQLETYIQKRGIGPGTVRVLLSSIVNVSKFIYKDETNRMLADNCDDIPATIMLRKLSRKYDKKYATYRKVHNQNTDGKMMPWATVQDVLEKKRMFFEGGVYINEKKLKKDKITDHTLADDLQRFLLLAFFTIMPPDRQRTIRELIYGTTLRYGFIDDNYNFISADKLTSWKTQYYIYLGEKDYKTWKTHGRWFAPVPNKKFDIPNKGKSFYDYLKQWLSDGYIDKNGEKQGYRNALNPKTQTFFVDRYGGQMSDNAVTNKIRNMIYSYTAIPSTPHTLRHIFSSRIYQGDIDEATLKAFHVWMKHSPKEAKTYTHLKQSEKIAKAIEAIESRPDLF